MCYTRTVRAIVYSAATLLLLWCMGFTCMLAYLVMPHYYYCYAGVVIDSVIIFWSGCVRVLHAVGYSAATYVPYLAVLHAQWGIVLPHCYFCHVCAVHCKILVIITLLGRNSHVFRCNVYFSKVIYHH